VKEVVVVVEVSFYLCFLNIRTFVFQFFRCMSFSSFYISFFFFKFMNRKETGSIKKPRMGWLVFFQW